MNYDNKEIIVSVSGGKDSTAMCLNLLEKGYLKSDFRRVFADTGWEDKSTYDYLDELEKTIGKIERIKKDMPIKEEYREYIEEFEKRLGWESPFIRRIINTQFFPKGFAKWCTVELKIQPFKEFFENLGGDYVNLVGIRKEESKRRSGMEEWEWGKFFDCWTHRPLINWTIKNVIDIHHRFNLAPNSLYLNGSNRVGCYPCIFVSKKEIKAISEDRILLIRDLEKLCTKLWNDRTGNNDTRTFFKPRNGSIMTVTDVYEWSKTTRGGKQFELFSSEERSCVKWGMCGT
tara:strand:- start:203 stop:1066 length:864 start_codon:yes stop_codon:yes gene_type:complete